MCTVTVMWGTAENLVLGLAACGAGWHPRRLVIGLAGFHRPGLSAAPMPTAGGSSPPSIPQKAITNGSRCHLCPAKSLTSPVTRRMTPSRHSGDFSKVPVRSPMREDCSLVARVVAWSAEEFWKARAGSRETCRRDRLTVARCSRVPVRCGIPFRRQPGRRAIGEYKVRRHRAVAHRGIELMLRYRLQTQFRVARRVRRFRGHGGRSPLDCVCGGRWQRHRSGDSGGRRDQAGESPYVESGKPG